MKILLSLALVAFVWAEDHAMEDEHEGVDESYQDIGPTAPTTYTVNHSLHAVLMRNLIKNFQGEAREHVVMTTTDRLFSREKGKVVARWKNSFEKKTGVISFMRPEVEGHLDCMLFLDKYTKDSRDAGEASYHICRKENGMWHDRY